MNLIQATKIVNDKTKNRDKLLGQKEMLMASLKKLGFISTDDAQKERTKLQKELDKLNAHYAKGEKTFKTKFEHLLTE